MPSTHRVVESPHSRKGAPLNDDPSTVDAGLVIGVVVVILLLFLVLWGDRWLTGDVGDVGDVADVADVVGSLRS